MGGQGRGWGWVLGQWRWSRGLYDTCGGGTVEQEERKKERIGLDLSTGVINILRKGHIDTTPKDPVDRTYTQHFLRR